MVVIGSGGIVGDAVGEGDWRRDSQVWRSDWSLFGHLLVSYFLSELRGSVYCAICCWRSWILARLAMFLGFGFGGCWFGMESSCSKLSALKDSKCDAGRC